MAARWPVGRRTIGLRSRHRNRVVFRPFPPDTVESHASTFIAGLRQSRTFWLGRKSDDPASVGGPGCHSGYSAADRAVRLCADWSLRPEGGAGTYHGVRVGVPGSHLVIGVAGILRPALARL